MAQQLDPSIFGPTAKRKRCSVEGCEKDATKRGMCSGHNWRARHGKPLNTPVRPYLVNGGPCSIPRCGRPSRTKNLCAGHYRRLLGGRADWNKVLRPRTSTSAHLGTPTVPLEVLRLLDREAEACGMARLEMVRRILTRWAAETKQRRGL